MLHLFRSLPWVHTAADLARFLAFALFVLLAIRVARRPGSGTRKTLLVYSLVVTCITGFTQIEAWPFTTWALVHHISQTQMMSWPLIARDASGKAWPIDIEFVQPIPAEDFETAMKYTFLGLDKAAKDDEARFLLARAEEARKRFRATGRIGTNGTIIGPLAAPYHFVRGGTWHSLNDVPATPFVSFEIWEEHWDVEQRWHDESRVTRTVLYRYPS